MKKFKEWWNKIGITSIGYGIAFGYFLFKGFTNFNLWIFLAGAALGIFVYLNFNVIKKLIKRQFN